MKMLITVSLALSMLATGAAFTGNEAFSAKKKKTYTAEQRKKIQAEAWKICRKSGYHVVQAEVNWTTLKVTCWYR